MRLVVLTTLTMTAFAANSVLNRLALKGEAIAALDFAAIRLVSGAVVLAALCVAQRRGAGLTLRGQVPGGIALLTYMIGFSLAYVALDAGTGALILFGGVQITMFAGAISAREPLPARRVLGAALAFGGLLWLLWPGTAGAPPLWPSLSMGAAAVGWGLYSLMGRRQGDPLARTAASFLLAAPLAMLASGLDTGGVAPTAAGVTLAVASGALTSGLGYALWYALLPALGASRGAVAQLTVPVIAAAGGAMLLGEIPDLRFALAALMVLGGVAYSTMRRV